MCRSLLGGFLSQKYLGNPEPKKIDLTTSSLSKYKYVIDQWGGWALFQVRCLCQHYFNLVFFRIFQTYDVQEFVYFALYHPFSVGMVKVLKQALASYQSGYHKVIDYRYVGLKIK